MTAFGTILGFLLLAHILADFYLQPYPWIMCKVKHKEKSIGLLKHMSVHIVLTSIALMLALQVLSAQIFIALGIIIITHYAIDIWKTYMGFTFQYFVLDQLGHLIVLVGVSAWLSGSNLESIFNIFSAPISIKYGIFFMGYLIAYKPLSILIQLLLRPYLDQFDTPDGQNSGLQTAGEHIGALERILIITFVLLGEYSGIGFLLAAKSVFRFGDMRRQHDRKLTEYIMLGTLLSFTFAILLGLLILEIS